ncbi:MAG: ammonia-forming cytochrome c nitrite reductase subunit c552 [Deltaproteobacteria bacterium]|nr:ammonia-forming cytochrome c nitrite reductase subunit c552 [Deltaproteobacteria bacterium]
MKKRYNLALQILIAVAFSSTPLQAQDKGSGKVVLPLGAAQPTKAIRSGQEFFKGATFVGADTCKSCHAKQYDEWAKTWHRKMEQLPSAQSVAGEFDNIPRVYKDLEVESLKEPKKREKISPTIRAWKDAGKFFFTLIDRDNEKNNQTYEVAKVLGGKWDQGYEVKVGENYYPTPIRWSAVAKAWIARGFRADEWFLGDGTPDGIPRGPDQLLPHRVAEAKCAMCHTTGFTPMLDKETKKWKAAAPYELGISCEKCHGPGSLHVQEAKEAEGRGQRLLKAEKIIHPLKDLNTLQQNQVCGQCHGRNTNKRERDLAFPVGFLPGDTNIQDLIYFWSYSGTPDPAQVRYFWPNDWAKRNRQQWQDFTKSTHFTKTDVTCLTCHTFHGDWFENQLRLPREKLCAECHTRDGLAKRPNVEMFAGSPMEKAGTTCVDCHMPKIGNRTVATTKTPALWDVTSHTFMVATPELTVQHGVRNSCAACHTPGETRDKAIPLVAEAAHAMLKGRQVEIRTMIDQAQVVLRGAEAMLKQAEKTARGTVAEKSRRQLLEAKDNLAFVLLDGSLGFHNYERAKDLVQKASVHATEAKKALGRTAPRK